jgi:hypothetical protein
MVLALVGDSTMTSFFPEAVFFDMSFLNYEFTIFKIKSVKLCASIFQHIIDVHPAMRRILKLYLLLLQLPVKADL